MKKIIILLTLLFALQCYAQNSYTFSINTKAKNKINLKQLYIPFSLIIAGITNGAKEKKLSHFNAGKT